MEKRNTHIDEQLKGIFESFEPAVPFQFEAVASQLDARKSRRRKVLGSIAATVVITAVSGILFLMPDTASVKELSTTSTTINNSESLDSKSEPLKNATTEKGDLNTSNSSTNNFETETIVSGISDEVNQSTKNISNGLRASNTSALTPNSGVRSESLGNQGLNVKLTAGFDLNSVNGSGTQINSSFQESFESDVLLNPAYNISGKTLSYMPNTFGILQLPVRSLLPQMPQQPLSSWAFEVGYDQNQTALAYQISPGREKYVHKNYLNRIQEGELALAAPQFQAALKYQWNKNWSVSVGLGFAQTRTMQRFNFRDSIPFSVAQGNEADGLGNYPIFGYFGLGQLVSYEGIKSFQMLSIPVGLGYRVPINRFWSINAEWSMRYNLLMASQGRSLNYHDLSLMDDQSDAYRSHIWSTRIGAGAEYRMSRNQYLGFRLNTQGALSPFYKSDASIQNRGWSVGMSVFYTIKLF